MTRPPRPQPDSREPMSSRQRAVLAVLLVPTFASLLSVDARLAALSEGALEVAQQFDSETMTRRLINLYEDLLVSYR